MVQSLWTIANPMVEDGSGLGLGALGLLPPRVALGVVHLHALQVDHAVGPPRRQQGSVEDHQRRLGKAPDSSPSELYLQLLFFYFFYFFYIILGYVL